MGEGKLFQCAERRVQDVFSDCEARTAFPNHV